MVSSFKGDPASGRRSSMPNKHKGEVNLEELPGMDKVAAGRQSTTPQIERLQKEQETFKAKADAERRRLEELQKQAEQLEAKVNQRRHKLGGPKAPRESAEQVKKQIKILDNRLEKALSKHNGTLAHNRHLRENIDNFRRERLVFETMQKKLERDLLERKKEMQHLIEVSNRAYEAREAAVTEMARLKGQADREHHVFESEFKELGRLIEHDRKMRDYMRMKSKEEQEALHTVPEEDDSKKVGRNRSGKGADLRTGSMSQRLATTTQNVNPDAVQSYSEAFAKIQASSGISEFDEIMNTFASAEDENYRLYKYIDQLTQEIARLEEQINDIQGEIERYRVVDEGKAMTHDGTLQEVKSRLTDTEAKAEALTTKQLKADELVEKVKGGIWAAFMKMGCGSEENQAAIGGEGITNRNMLMCLSLLEERTTELMMAYTAKLVSPEAAADLPNELPGGQVVTIEPPSTTDKGAASDSEEEEEEEEDRPLTRAELQVKTVKSLQKREAAAARKRQMKLDAANVKHEQATPKTPA